MDTFPRRLPNSRAGQRLLQLAFPRWPHAHRSNSPLYDLSDVSKYIPFPPALEVLPLSTSFFFYLLDKERRVSNLKTSFFVGQCFQMKVKNNSSGSDSFKFEAVVLTQLLSHIFSRYGFLRGINPGASKVDGLGIGSPILIFTRDLFLRSR